MSRSPIVTKRKLRNAWRRKEARRWRWLDVPDGLVTFRLVVESFPRFAEVDRILTAAERP